MSPSNYPYDTTCESSTGKCTDIPLKRTCKTCNITYNKYGDGNQLYKYPKLSSGVVQVCLPSDSPTNAKTLPKGFSKFCKSCSKDAEDITGCKNGGVCEPSTGKCICPLGFYGTYCEEKTQTCKGTTCINSKNPVDIVDLCSTDVCTERIVPTEKKQGFTFLAY